MNNLDVRIEEVDERVNLDQKPLSVSFLWHMHQPFYKDPFTNEYVLPWVRLHCVRDYLPMAELVDKFDDVKCVFNFSGVLLAQIVDQVCKKHPDIWARVSLMDPKYTSYVERELIIDNFFSNPKSVILKFDSYKQLLYKKETGKQFTDTEITALQTLFNLSWIHPMYVRSDKNLSDLTVKKVSSFKRDDVDYVIKTHHKLMKKVIPAYTKLSGDKKAEITVSAYHHPILPILCDIMDAKSRMPESNLPGTVASFTKDDAMWHIKESIKICKQIFGVTPKGTWPPEGAVSNKTLGLLKKAGFNWTATDEDILHLSSDIPVSCMGYYEVKLKEGGCINVFFRNKEISNLLSFDYHRWHDQEAAVDDFFYKLDQRRYAVKNTSNNMVMIALDGENAWKHYPEMGEPFLRKLYDRFSKDKRFCCILPKDWIKIHKPTGRIGHIECGSWIDANLSVWIGGELTNSAWHLSSKLKDTLVKKKINIDDPAYSHLMVCECSDWYWWYSGRFLSAHKDWFDYIFKNHLAAGFKEADEIIIPIKLKK